MRHRHLAVLAIAALVAVAADRDGFVDQFDVKPDAFASTGHNDYFSLEPGDVLTFEGKEGDKAGKLIITVLPETRVIDGVETRVIEERESTGGELIEVSRNYYAIETNTRDVYYFGEDVETFKNGKVDGHPGSWHSGVDGAHFGLFMPAKPTVGAKYYQELAPKVAMDRFEIVSVTETSNVPAGEFKNVVKTKETTPLEPDDVEYKLYAPGVGLLMDGGLKLVKHNKPE